MEEEEILHTRRPAEDKSSYLVHPGIRKSNKKKSGIDDGEKFLMSKLFRRAVITAQDH